MVRIADPPAARAAGPTSGINRAAISGGIEPSGATGQYDDAVVKLKVAANRYPRVAFWLATPADRTKTTWKIERVFP